MNGVAVTVDASGGWTTSVVTPAGDGPLTVTAAATDAAGNTATDTRDLTVDTVAAVAITTIEGGDDLINAAEAAGGITVSGTAEIGATLTVNGVAVPVDASGNWTTSVAPPAVDGPLTVAAVATDAAGNTATATQELTVDTTPPAVAITTIEGGDDLIDAAEAAGGITVSGTAEIGATLTVNGVAVPVDASGNWTTSVAPPAVDGPLTVTAVATDAAGNSATATHALTVDTAPPEVAITTVEGGDDLINAVEAAGGITVSGTAEIGATLTVNGVAVPVDASGNWTTSVAPPAVDGPLTVAAVATDAAGNTATATQELTVDTLAPAAPSITSIPENSGGGINASEVSDGTPVVVGLTGTGAVAGDRLTINWGRQAVNYTLLVGDISGNTATVTVPLATITTQGQGTFDVTAILTDAAGNTGASSPATAVTVDTEAPAAPLITSIPENAAGGSINASEASDGTPVVVDLTGTEAVAGDTLTVNWGGQTANYTLLPTDISAGSATVTVPAATITARGEGTFDVTATLTDAAGNASLNSTAASVTVDTVAPAVAITTIEGGDDLINAAEATGGIDVSGTAEIGATLTVNGVVVPVDASGGWTTSVVPAGDGPLTVTAVATDAAGNAAAATHELTVDTLPPAVAITTIEGGDDLINAVEAAGGITVSGTAEIGSTLTVDGVAVPVDASGNWTTSVTPAGDGPLPVTAVATDLAGNSATATQELTVDTLPPAVAITTIEGGDDLINAAEAAGGVTVSGTAEIGSTLTVNGVAVTVDASGGWTTDVATAGNGPLTVTAMATDATGNSATATHALTVDTLPPAVAITTIEGGDDLINAAEAAGGVTVSGTAEIGSTLTVNSVAVPVDASGAWTTSVTTAGDGPLTVTAVATDAAGNTATATHALTVDTAGPAAPVITSIAENDGGGINAGEAADGTPVVVDLTGTGAVAGDTLTLSWGGQAVTQLLVAGDITASSVTVTVPATTITTRGDGTFDVTATLTDAAGNPGANSPAFPVTVDTAGPLAPVITSITENDGGGINASEAADGTPVVVDLTGTGAVAGDTLTLSWGGQVVTKLLVAGDITATSATVTVPATTITAQGDGTFDVTATLTDAAGNPGANSPAFPVTVDTLPPAVAITTIEGGDDLINAAEAAGGVTVSGTAEIGATLTVNGAAATVDASGIWTTAVTPPAVDGPLTVAAVATDAAGNIATDTRDLTVDTVPPAVAITTIEGGDDLINAAEAAGGITVSGTAEIGSTLTVNGAAVTVDASGGWTTSVVPAGDGPLTVTAVAIDAAGNSATATHALTVDTAPPAVAITTIEGGDDLINAAEAAGGIDVSGTAEIGATLTVNGVTVPVDASGGWTTSVVPAGDGPLTVTAVATDVAGNTATDTRDLTVDSAAPAAPVITLIAENDAGGVNIGEVADGTPVVVDLTGTGAAAGDTLTLDWGGQVVTHLLVTGDITASSATVPVPATTITAQGDGSVEFTSKPTDAEGKVCEK